MKSPPETWEIDSSPKDQAGGSKKTFFFQCGTNCNKLPVDIRDTNSIIIFVNSIRTHFL